MLSLNSVLSIIKLENLNSERESRRRRWKTIEKIKKNNWIGKTIQKVENLTKQTVRNRIQITRAHISIFLLTATSINKSDNVISCSDMGHLICFIFAFLSWLETHLQKFGMAANSNRMLGQFAFLSHNAQLLTVFAMNIAWEWVRFKWKSQVIWIYFSYLGIFLSLVFAT